jgi:hypothetical protein
MAKTTGRDRVVIALGMILAVRFAHRHGTAAVSSDAAPDGRKFQRLA